jgi:hypothetical protein
MDTTLVSPEIFALGFIGYVVVGILSFSLISDTFILYYEVFLYSAIGLLFYVVGCQITLPDRKMVYLFLTVGIGIFYSVQEYGEFGLVLPVFGVFALILIGKMRGEMLVGIGILLLVIQLMVGGIPLYDPELRRANVSLLFIFGYVFLFLGITFMTKDRDIKYIVGLFLGSLVLLSLFTYRVYVLELIIVVVTSLYMLRKVRTLHVVAAAVPLFVLILGLGYIGVAYQEWKFNAIELFLFRPAFTVGVLSTIVHEAGYFGITHGKIWLHFTSTTIIGPHLFGYDCNITSTVMGPLIFDGGIFELGLMAFFGAALNTMYRKALQNREKIPYYAIVLAIFLVGVDVSFIPSLVLLLFAGLYLASDSGTKPWKVLQR